MPPKKYLSPRLPPAALSASGSRVEGLPSSQPVTQAPLFILLYTLYHSTCCFASEKKPVSQYVPVLVQRRKGIPSNPEKKKASETLRFRAFTRGADRI